MLSKNDPPLEFGRARTFPLPPDRTCASTARSMLSAVMTKLALPAELVADGTVAVSELVTNSLLHAGGTDTELWIWLRSAASPTLIVTVFDTGSGSLPHPVRHDVLSESGRGLAIVAALATDAGIHRSRSRLRPTPVSGKATWFALPLPDDRPLPTRSQSPLRTARLLLLELCTRGLFAHHVGDVGGNSVVAVDDLRIEISRTRLTWRTADGTTITHQLPDLQDSIEVMVSHLETREAGGVSASPREQTTAPDAP
ncbi:ATP-binding protein [Actinomadura rupiterrae]|uniref:ATP-binding protein n=1 Tax=Actinomadura rupiterrae TaxID=559627 RepID=UPI0020A59683|nr:ATP-binding protein [Actinomadura rupiterrae]MCP2337524.1 anti-sigma regulatory factor (Ser/Thr protein kinase) [Actinomadura rupiterrae]